MEDSPSQDGARSPDLGNLRSIVEAINNLVYVAMHEADHPELVRFYLKAAEERLKLLNEALKSNLLR